MLGTLASVQKIRKYDRTERLSVRGFVSIKYDIVQASSISKPIIEITFSEHLAISDLKVTTEKFKRLLIPLLSHVCST